jgi:hypothetical protein
LGEDLRDRFKPVEVLQRWDANAQVGGPVMKRKVWFFAGAEHFRDAYRPVSFSGAPRRAGEPSVTTTDRKYIAKLTSALRNGVRAEGFVARTSSEEFGLNASPLVSPEALGVGETTGSLWSARLLWQLGNRGAIEARHGGTVTSMYVGPEDGMQGGPPARFDQVTGAWSGNYPSHSTARYQPVRTAAVVTYWAGQARPHELRSGVEHEHASLYSRHGLVGGRLFLDADGQPSTVTIASDATYRPKQNRWTWFGQDSWSAAERLTLNIGARVGAYRGGVPTNEQAFSAVTVSPRIGAALVVNSRHQTVARAHYGRYHDHPATSFYDFLDPLSDAPTIVAQVVGPEEFVEIARTLSGVDARIDPELDFPFAQEMLVGVESALPRGFTAKAQVILRDFEDTVGFVDRGSQWAPTERRDPGPDGRVGTSDDGELIMVFVNDGRRPPSLELTNPEAAYRRYRAVQFVATKRHADQLNVQASYTWSRTVGSYNNLFASNAAGGDLGTNGSFTDPNRLINTAGRTPQDFTHDLKVLATHHLHLLGGFNVSGVYRFQSGRTWARSARFPPQILSLVFVEPRATRQLPAVHTLDIRVEKTWRPGGARVTVGWFAEIFNVGNQGVALRVNNASGPNLGLPTQWSEPRVVRAGARVMF